MVLALRASAQENLPQLEQSFRQSLVSKDVTLRAPYTGNNVVLDANGNCEAGCGLGSWMKDATQRVRQIEITSDSLFVTGDRLVLYYDQDDQRKAILSPYPVRVRIRLGRQPSHQSVAQALSVAFRASSEPPPSSLPPNVTQARGPFEVEERKKGWFVRNNGAPEWKRLSDFDGAIQVGESIEGEKVYLISKAIKPPRVIAAPDPVFPAEERQNRQQGTVRLRVIVDRTGQIQAAKLEKSPLPGFVAASLMAVSKWKFEPATLGGEPVACVIHIEVNFRLH